MPRTGNSNQSKRVISEMNRKFKENLEKMSKKEYIVCYDLNRKGVNYSKNSDKITGYFDGLKQLAEKQQDTTWLVRSDLDYEELYDNLHKFIGADDGLFVSRVYSSSYMSQKSFKYR